MVKEALLVKSDGKKLVHRPIDKRPAEDAMLPRYIAEKSGLW